MDNIDRITELEQGLFELRLKTITGKPIRPSALKCTECANAIPARRRHAELGRQEVGPCGHLRESL